jgi:hypothetical protein
MTRLAAVLAPILLFLYGVLRLVDGRDGEHGPGLAWNVGHALFFAAFMLLALLTLGLRRLVADGATPARQVVSTAATAVALFGIGCFLWVIAGDLFEAVPDLPDAVQLVGPLTFQLGTLVLMGQLVAVRRLPVWSPVLLLAGFVLIAVNLDLLPLAALVILGALAPLARPARHAVADAPSRG